MNQLCTVIQMNNLQSRHQNSHFNYQAVHFNLDICYALFCTTRHNAHAPNCTVYLLQKNYSRYCLPAPNCTRYCILGPNCTRYCLPAARTVPDIVYLQQKLYQILFTCSKLSRTASCDNNQRGFLWHYSVVILANIRQ